MSKLKDISIIFGLTLIAFVVFIAAALSACLIAAGSHSIAPWIILLVIAFLWTFAIIAAIFYRYKQSL